MSRACLVWWLLFLVILKLGALNVHLGFVVGCHEAEREALLKFRQSLNDTKNVLSFWKGKDCCRWAGVGCDNVTFYVSHLDVQGLYYDPNDFGWLSSIIASKLDRSLVELSRLKYLDLSGIDFQGSPIPGFVGSFKNLRYLDLSNSNFGGVIPSQVGNLTRLHTLDLSMYFDSPYPITLSSDLHWVSSLVSLRYLNMNKVRIYRSMKSTHMLNMPALLGLQLSSCQLTVPSLINLFSNFTWLSSIQQLDLSLNEFEGSLPTVFANMTSLKYLNLAGTVSYKSFPLWLQYMRKLELLDLSANSLEGPLPHVFANMTSLTYLGLSGNHLNGSIPLWIQNMGKLQNLDLSENKFSQVEGGAIMGILGNMCKLKSFYLSRNSIGGEIGAHLNLSKCATYDLETLDLSGGNRIGGTLPSWLGNFKSLRYLDISDNAIEGAIPVSIGSLSYLEELQLSLNNLTGTLPNSLGGMIKLRAFLLGDNRISGQIPTSIAKLSSLEELDLFQNSINSSIPEGLGQCKALVMIDLSSNSLQGVVSESLFTNLSSLDTLDLSANSLEVNFSSNWSPPFQLSTLKLRSCKMQTQFPKWIGKQASLFELDISSNSLQGVVSESLFTNLSDLKYLDLSSNSLEVNLDSLFTNLPNLQYLDLSSNSLEVNLSSNWLPPFQLSRLKLRSCKMQTQFPQWIAKQINLVELDLSDNAMSWKLDSLFRLRNLEVVNISQNQFTGPVPYFSTSIISIDLSYNLLSGPLVLVDPSAKNDTVGTPVCQLPNLRFLDLQRNNIVGTIPDCWGNSSNMEYINLSSNNLSGIIPMSMGQPPRLQFLKLSNNSLQGPIPPTLSASSWLQILDLGENKLVGNIPIAWDVKTHPILQMLRLRGNQLVGVIPKTLCTLPRLQLIDLAHNNLTGSVPRCFGSNLMGMKLSPSEYDNDYIDQTVDYVDPLDDSTAVVLKGAVLQYTTTLKYVVNLDLSCNALVGSIPDEITNLSSLIGLNLSHNHLTGVIPKGIGEMTSLESLDLSNNNLSGTIPSSISNLTSLININVSNNKLHGQIPTGNQLQTLTDPSSYEGNPGLCGDPLPNKCGTSRGRNQPKQEQKQHDREEDLENPLFYFVIISGVATGFWGVVGSLLLKNRFRFALFQLVDKVADYLYVQVMVRLNRFRN